jgi:universal stress protein A
MISIQKILVPTDLSPCSKRALGAAQTIATAFSATIDLLYVWAVPTLVAPEAVITGLEIDEQPLIEWLRSGAHELLGKFEAEAKGSGIAVGTSFCVPGDPATTILEHAASGGYDLLVLGTHGRSGLSHVFLGSVAEKVVRRAPCPVLTVRASD